MRLRRLLGRLSPSSATDLRGLAGHPLLPLVFDGGWYLARYPDVLGAGLDPLSHFLGSGVTEMRDPSPYVHLRYIATQLPALAGDGSALLRHLLESGLEAGVATSPFVDLPWYARSNGLAEDDELGAFSHLVTSGRSQRLAPGPFLDLAWYANHFPDIPLSGVDPFEYFVSMGQWLGRFPHPLWAESAYIAGNEYVRFAVGVGKYATGFEHFCATGHTEVARGAVSLPVRIDGTMDEYAEDRYLAANPDVAAAVASGQVANGVVHLFTSGHTDIAKDRRELKHPVVISTATLELGANAPMGDLLIILVHFDVDSIIDEHVLGAIDTYRASGADVCVVTVGLGEGEIELLRSRTSFIVQKSSNDDLRDFGGWSLALQLLGSETLDRYSRVALTNDSVYFPARDPESFLAFVRGNDADIVAATDSLSGGRYHLQSYFLALNRTAREILSPEIMRRVEEQSRATKLSLIQRFEVGLSQFAIERGLKTAAFCSVAEIPDIARALSPPDARPVSHLGVSVINTTHHCWRHALDLDVPFLKVELLRDNPLDVDITGWQDAVTGACTADMIEAHLARVRR